MDLLQVARDLSDRLEAIRFSSPVAYVYNPLVYAREPFEQYLRRYGTGNKKTILLGMNPGPWGMAQTGVPFGEIRHVMEWLRISGKVESPLREHPKKKVTGFCCKRSEVSGLRLWGLVAERFGTPESFFRDFYVANYCPLLFIDPEGRNLTPDKLAKGEQAQVNEACNDALRRTVEILQPAHVIGIGKYAEKQALDVLAGTGVCIGGILHPSPQNPQANRAWKQTVLEQFVLHGIPFGKGEGEG